MRFVARVRGLLLTVGLAAGLQLAGVPAASAQTASITLGYAKCAHCVPLSPTPRYGGPAR
ncbi:MAG TPA: hypothetical protein VNT30_10595 [Stellaceae bacterium]|nr:hypothetical protein [Stellaceae bacterium]